MNKRLCVGCNESFESDGVRALCAKCLFETVSVDKDLISHPPYYEKFKIEVIEAIEAWNLPHHLACVVKYVARAGIKNKDTAVEDLKKARWYLSRWISLLDGTAGKPKDQKS